jgi:hypothetical protein
MRDTVDPIFDVKFDEATHGEYLRETLKLDHLSSERQARPNWPERSSAPPN